MICVRCPFTMLCFSGRLDAEGGGAALCVKCGQLSVLIGDTVYRFKCERRPLTSELITYYRKKRAEIQKPYPQRKFASTMLIDDPGPGLCDKLRLVHCAACSYNKTIKSVLGTAVSLDELEKAKEESGQHTFEIAGGVSRKP